MGGNEGKSSTAEKSSPPAPPEHNNVHVYPDWAAMQAYYGPRVAIPPYYNSTVPPGHAPHPYMWAPPSPMMAPYGTPYPAFCPPGGVYAHPGLPMGSHSQVPPVQGSPAATTPVRMDNPAKSPGNTDHGFMKKLKEFDGLAMSIGNGKAESAERGDEPRTSQSSENEGSSNGSDGNTTGGEQSKRKRSREGTPAIDGGHHLAPSGEANGKPAATMLASGMPTALELRSSSGMNGAPQPCAVVPPEIWLQNEKEQKRERRKQSNRESARRSRLRKQAETEELARKVDSLAAENMTLRSEIDQLNEKSEKLRQENTALLDKLKTGRVNGNTEQNLLSRVDNKNSGSGGEGEATYEKSSSSGTKKLHQLLDTSPRTDAVAAS